MSRRSRDKKPEVVESGLREMKLEGSDSQEDEAPDAIRGAGIKRESTTPNGTASPRKSGSKSPEKTELKTQDSASSSPSENIDKVETVTGDVTVKMEPGQAPKLARSSSQKIIPQPAQLFDHLPEKTTEATATFSLMADCTYSAKYLGATEHSMECDCTEEWNSSSGTNAACGEDSDCINRATKMECAPDCGCGTGCQNQRFQRKEYANVSVIQTEKKGYGLRAESQLTPHQFIFEYLGEVINEVQFRRRMRDYDEEGIKHFYFMSLSKGEFIDATKKGNLGRFCNHSCNPNCYVDKWVVGDKLRMGIFAKRVIRPGEELVFNYNVDRYGADPQPCYCGEPNCTGYIGGKTQTERATKLSIDTIEALGIEDHDSWDTAVARRPRRKKAAGEDDEEYVNNLEPRALNEEGVTKVMATLLQCKEKWIAVKLLGRIQRCNEERVINRVVKMHGYQILNSSLSSWKDDFNVVLQILEILNKFPRLTRNKISDSKIDVTVDSLLTCGDDRVETGAAAILKEWSTLEVGYRIPRKKRDPNGNATPSRPERFDRRESVREERRERSKSRSKSRSRSRSPEAPRGPAAGNNPRGSGQQRKNFYNGPRAPRRTFNPLPPGWFSAVSNGNTYYYSASGQTTWSRPTTAAAQPPPPPKVISSDKKLQEIIDSITKSATPKEKTPASATPQQQQPQSQAKGPEKTPTKPKEKWRSYNEEKRKKVYENTV
ncbi:SET domain-containing protein [Xylona heveae TC161]|uniref:Histone-lysine N-methyltransferase, H3 lysine-36 specific n=1 Tax=Xylona heveae (strain CBS 132557 / TC161) TaxID=1328760 RepID=A0A165GTW7_XYLHT|nr:SET domain-containing protein [Xylona heveae TC161]KZF22593.1 SET domain-containing protein [Xylona heveae TC161]